MSSTPISDRVREYALAQVGAAYIMGATAVKCTPKYRRFLAEGRSADYAEAIIDNCPVLSGKRSSCDGCKYEDRLSFDCAQLSKFAAAAGGISLPSGSNSQWTKVDWAITGEIASLPMDVVCFVFRHNDKKNRKVHVGVYLGDGTVSDARGHGNGVLHKDVSSYPWTHYAIPVEIAKEVGLDMSDRPTYAEMRRDTIRKGSKDNAVAELQGLLNAWDPELQLAVDGQFGAATHAAVILFQQAHGLTDDGIVGPNTWSVLLKLDVDLGEDADDDIDVDEPMEPSKPPMDEIRATLFQGSKGDDVRELQRILRSLGYTLEIDGKFGPLTTQCVKSFQGAAGLPRDGAVGPKTWAALDAAASGERYTVVISGLLESVARELTTQYGGTMTAEGGEPHV